MQCGGWVDNGWLGGGEQEEREKSKGVMCEKQRRVGLQGEEYM